MQTKDNKIRAGWKTGTACQIYSTSKNKWFCGEITQIFTDEEGEWLEVIYDKSMSKQVQRYSTGIRPHVESSISCPSPLTPHTSLSVFCTLHSGHSKYQDAHTFASRQTTALRRQQLAGMILCFRLRVVYHPLPSLPS